MSRSGLARLWPGRLASNPGSSAAAAPMQMWSTRPRERGRVHLKSSCSPSGCRLPRSTSSSSSSSGGRQHTGTQLRRQMRMQPGDECMQSCAVSQEHHSMCTWESFPKTRSVNLCSPTTKGSPQNCRDPSSRGTGTPITHAVFPTNAAPALAPPQRHHRLRSAPRTPPPLQLANCSTASRLPGRCRVGSDCLRRRPSNARAVPVVRRERARHRQGASGRCRARLLQQNEHMRFMRCQET